MKRWKPSRGRCIAALSATIAFWAVVSTAEADTELPQYFPEGAYTGFTLAWYSNELMILREPSLFEARGSEGESYRLLFSPSFEDSYSIRIDVMEDGSATMRVATGRLESYRTYGDRLFDVVSTFKGESQRALSGFELSIFKETFNEMNICNAPPDEVLGLDGYTFVFEWRGAGRYCVADRWTPDPGPFLSVGKLMLRMAGVW